MNIFEDFYLNIKLINEDVILPSQSEGNDGNTGYEIYSIKDYSLNPGDEVLISTGWCCEFPKGFAMIIKDKSGRRWKGKLQTGAGVIDSNYRDEVRVVLKNIGVTPITINKGESVAQFITIPTWNGKPSLVEELHMENDRGGGFGSTGLTKK